MPDIWSLVTGVASIVSLFLALGSRFDSWKKYTVPAGSFLGGLTIGRLSAILPFGFSQLMRDESSAAFLIIFFAVLISVAIVAYWLMRRNETGLGYVLFLMGISILAPQMIRLYFDYNAAISTGDYLILANVKEQADSFEDALRYFEKYESKISDKQVKEEIEKRIASLRSRLADRVAHSPSGGSNDAANDNQI